MRKLTKLILLGGIMLVLAACSNVKADKEKKFNNDWVFGQVMSSTEPRSTFWGSNEYNVLDVEGENFVLYSRHYAVFDGTVVSEEKLASGKIDYKKKQLLLESFTPRFAEDISEATGTDKPEKLYYRLPGDKEFDEAGIVNTARAVLYFADPAKEENKERWVSLLELKKVAQEDNLRISSARTSDDEDVTEDSTEPEEETTYGSSSDDGADEIVEELAEEDDVEPEKTEERELTIKAIPMIADEGRMYIDISGDFPKNRTITLDGLVRNKDTGAEKNFSSTYMDIDTSEAGPYRGQLYAGLPDGNYTSEIFGEIVYNGIRYKFKGSVDSVIKDEKFMPETFE